MILIKCAGYSNSNKQGVVAPCNELAVLKN